MTKRLKIIISAVAAIIVCILAVVTIVIVLQKDTETEHLRANGISMKLIRNSLDFYELGEDEIEREKTDSTPKDFTNPSSENIFGVTGNVQVNPGSKITAHMEISSEAGSFVYWLGIELSGGMNEFAEQLVVTVQVKDSPQKMHFSLADGLTLGSEAEPIAIVTETTSSAFSVTVEFDHDSSINDEAQNQLAVFDLVVYAVPYVGN